MPHGNRVSSSSALKMTGIWTNTIGYDPYAAEGGGADAEDEANAFEQAQGLMALAKLSNQGVSGGRVLPVGNACVASFSDNLSFRESSS